MLSPMTKDAGTLAGRFAGQAERFAESASWLRALQEKAYTDFSAHGFPTPAEETWKYTNLSALSSMNLTRKPYDVEGQTIRLRSHRFGAEKTAAELIFIDGHFEPALSTWSIPEGLATLSSIGEAVVSDEIRLRKALDQSGSDPLMNLNLSFLDDGAYLRIHQGAAVVAPIHLLFVSSGSGMTNPRVIILAGEGSQVSVVESFVGPEQCSYFTNAVTTIEASAGSVVDHYRLQREGNEAYHIANLRIRQSRSSSVTSRVVSLGARLSRQQIETKLEGEGSSATLDGLFLLSGRQHADHNTIIDHVSPNTTSVEFYKGILDDESRGIFDGKIIVRKDAQKTNSRQVNRNLLLSPKAIVDSKPQLEINADDVKCTHGSTIGQLDENALFYMQARGIGKDEAKNLLMYAFASELVERMKVEPVRDQLQSLLLERLGSAKGEAR